MHTLKIHSFLPEPECSAKKLWLLKQLWRVKMTHLSYVFFVSQVTLGYLPAIMYTCKHWYNEPEHYEILVTKKYIEEYSCNSDSVRNILYNEFSNITNLFSCKVQLRYKEFGCIAHPAQFKGSNESSNHRKKRLSPPFLVSTSTIASCVFSILQYE